LSETPNPGRATPYRVRLRTWLARLIYPGDRVWILHGHQASSGGPLPREKQLDLRCTRCGAPVRRWPEYDCAMTSGTMETPRSFYIGPRKRAK
jgi:hypothetical protein